MLRYEFGVHSFYFEYITVKTKILKPSFDLFDKSEPKEELVEKQIRETNKQLWKRINNHININNWFII